MASSKRPIAFLSHRFSIILHSRNRPIFHFTIADSTFFFFFFVHLPRSDTLFYTLSCFVYRVPVDERKERGRNCNDRAKENRDHHAKENELFVFDIACSTVYILWLVTCPIIKRGRIIRSKR